MGRSGIVEYTPRSPQFNDVGYTLKHTRVEQDLHVADGLIQVNTGPNVNMLHTATWVVFDSRWEGEELFLNDPSYNDLLEHYSNEQLRDPEGVHIISGTERTVVLRRARPLE